MWLGQSVRGIVVSFLLMNVYLYDYIYINLYKPLRGSKRTQMVCSCYKLIQLVLDRGWMFEMMSFKFHLLPTGS